MTQPIVVVLWALSALTLPACQSVQLASDYTAMGKAMGRAEQTAGARLYHIGDTPVLELSGTPEQMGSQYGTLMRPAIQALSRLVERALGPRQIERYERFAEEHEKNVPADYRAEIRAMSVAAEVPYRRMLALNVVPRLACSTLAVWDPGRPGSVIMGRNADYFSLGNGDRGFLVVVFKPAQGKAVAAISFLGMVGAFSGMNADGVSFGNMLVFNQQGRALNSQGMNVQLALRQAAHQAGTARQMARLLEGGKHVIPNNVMVADADQAFVVELGPDRTALRESADGVLAASNHFRVRGMYDQPERCPRYEALDRAGHDAAGRMSVADMCKALAASKLNGLNLQAIVFEPAARRFHISMNRNPAADGPYQEIEMRRLLEVPATRPAAPIN